MDSRDEMDVAADGSNRIQRACDACRSRKIRCDRATPCSNCRGSKLTCTTTAPVQKPQRQRIHISDEYERKIDRIEDRLAGIEHVLESLASKLANLDLHRESSERSSQSRSGGGGTGRSAHSSSDVNANTPVPFEGETTMNRQSELAQEFLEQAVRSTPSIEQNAELKAALSSLQDMVSRQGHYTNTIAMSTPHPFFRSSVADFDCSKLESPPWDAVNEVIDKASVYPTMSFAVVFPFLKMRNIKEISKQIFDTPAECTVGRRILVYGVLYNLFLEFSSYPVVNPRVESYRAYARICKTQMEVAISQLDLYIPATYENILALLLGAAYAIEMCKPSLCWVMISNAAGLCQSLGYHRIQTMKDDNEDERMAKVHVFWFIYLMDKTLSLRLGRASLIQDWDMSLPYPTLENETTPFGGLLQDGPKGTDMLLYWIRVGQIQGKTYEKLFSPAAFLRPQEERAHIAAELVSAMNEAWAGRGEASALDFAFKGVTLPSYVPKKTGVGPSATDPPSKQKRSAVMYPTPAQQSFGASPIPMRYMEESFGAIGDIFYHSDVVVHYSTCALIQRACSPDTVTFSQDCLESARAALVAHQRCSEQFNVKGNEDLWSGYIHWSILQAPFTPFIVIFCNAILRCDPSDLNSLSEFVLSLESCRTVSEGADKLYKMCHLFLQVAKLYVEAKIKESGDHPQQHSQTTESGFYQTDGGEQSLDMSAMTQFDPYLSALGLMPNSAWPMAGFPPSSMATSTGAGSSTGMEAFSPGHGFDGSLAGGLSGNQVQDWFSGSRYLMNLMEDDIQMPDLNL